MNLDGIIKDYPGAEGRAEHPAIPAIKDLEAALALEEEGAEEHVKQKLAAIDTLLSEGEGIGTH